MLTISLLTALALPAPATVAAPPQVTTSPGLFRAPTVLRNLAPQPGIAVGLSENGDIDAVVAGTGAEPIDSIDSLKVFLLEVPRGTPLEVYEGIIGEIAGKPDVIFAEPDRKVAPPELTGCAVTPIDPSAQDCLVSFFDGTPTNGEYFDQPAGAQIKADKAQKFACDQPTVVAVIDTGIDPTHPILQHNLFSLGLDLVVGEGPAIDVANGIDDDGDGLADESYGHGTHTAGSVVLVHPNALIQPYRVLDSDGNGNGFAVAAAIVDAIDKGVDVINMSLGMSGDSTPVANAVAQANQAGIAVIASAGNTGGEVLFPGAYPEVFAVAAVDPMDVKASFSAFGGDVAFCAPGVDVYSAMPEGQFAWWSGSSMATAIASGAVALTRSVGELSVKDKHHGNDDDDGNSPCNGPTDLVTGVEAALMVAATAKNIDGLNPGLEGQLGQGRINALKAALAYADDDDGHHGGDDDDDDGGDDDD